MADSMYSTPIMGTSTALGGINPMQFQRNTTLMGTTMPTMPQVSTVMPSPIPTVTQTPQVSTVMPPMPTTTQTPQVSTPMPPMPPIPSVTQASQTPLSYRAIFSADPDTIFSRRNQDGISFTVPSKGYSSNFAENQQRFKANFETFYAAATPSSMGSFVGTDGVTQNRSMLQFPPLSNDELLNNDMRQQTNLAQNNNFQNQIKQNIGAPEVSVPLVNNFAAVSSFLQKTQTQIPKIFLPVNTFYGGSSTSNGIRQNSATIVATNRYPVNVFYTNSR